MKTRALLITICLASVLLLSACGSGGEQEAMRLLNQKYGIVG